MAGEMVEHRVRVRLLGTNNSFRKRQVTCHPLAFEVFLLRHQRPCPNPMC
jgi:hypothetical protein